MNKRTSTFLKAAFGSAAILMLANAVLGNEIGPSYLEVLATAWIAVWVEEGKEQ